MKLVTLLASLALAFASATFAAPPPNIVIIFMDDMGYGDLGSYGAIGYTTPNLDQLATQGMRFTQFYAAQAVCSASRASMLTGCYANRVGFHGALPPNSKIGISDQEELIPQLLKRAGYRTAAVGKWHLGDSKKFLPLQHGFDEYLGLPYSNDMWPIKPDGSPWPAKANRPELSLIDGNDRVRPIRTFDDQDQLTTLYTERATDFIRRNREHPFFLYLAHSMTHVPLGVSSKFKGKSQQGLFGDVMMEVDWSVGEVMRALRENGVSDNTLVIFTSDNGPWLNFGNHAGSTGGLREGKGTSFEGGQRVPCLVRWPGHVPAGTICNALSCTIDVLPTLCAITGAPLPKAKIDGVNILPLFLGEPGANPRDHLFYYYRQNNLEAVRKGSWKFVFAHPGRTYEGFPPGRDRLPGKVDERYPFKPGLYDLRRDPGERYDVKDENPEVVRELEALAETAREDLGDDLTNRPGKNRREPGRVE